MEMSNEATRALLVLIRNDTAYTDVELVFEGGVVLPAHAVVLASTNDYYKKALSAKWTQGRETAAEENVQPVADVTDLTLAHFTKDGRALAKPTGRKLTLTHPAVRAEIGKIVLDFLYFGDAEIASSLIASVIAFADEILAANLVQKCIDYLAKENKLSAEHALEFYLLCDRIHGIEDRKSFALSKILQDLPLSLECGRKVLAQMNEREVETLLLFEPFAPIDRWRILIAWCKACQGTEGDVALESNLADNFQIELASKLIEPLVPVVELLKIPASHSNLLEPFLALLPESVQAMLAFQLKGKTRSGENQWKSDVLLLSQTDPRQNLMEIMRAIKQYLPVSFSSRFAPAIVTSALYHGTPGKSSAEHFHFWCDGKPNTLTFIKLKTGSIVGGFAGVPWSSNSRFRQCNDSFMFLISPSGVFRHLPWEDRGSGGILGQPYSEPIFGLNHNLFVDDNLLLAKISKDSFSGFDEAGGCAFLKELSMNGDARGTIEYYQVHSIC
ncbi:hypothetical protein HDU78_010305 [Chytriomyces hyalinus]|nr:hypothetical protein HDU78_010305 [Chytriomyces hyalinus]